MLFRKVAFRTDLFDAETHLREIVQKCKALKQFSYQDYVEQEFTRRARLVPLWRVPDWRSPVVDNFWEADEPTTFEGIFSEEQKHSDFEQRMQAGATGAVDVNYRFSLANVPENVHTSEYGHHFTLGKHLQSPLSFTLKFSMVDTEAVREERNFILSEARKSITRLKEIDFESRDGDYFCTNASETRELGIRGTKKSLDGISLHEMRGITREIVLDYPLEKRRELFSEFSALKEAVQDRFRDRYLFGTVREASMNQLTGLHDLSMFGEGNFVLNGHLLTDFDIFGETSVAAQSIPIGRLKSETDDHTDVDLQLVHCDGGRFFLEFLPVWLDTRARIDRCREVIEKEIVEPLTEHEGDFRFRWSKLTE